MLRSSLLFLFAISTLAQAQLNPAITSWVINPGGETGYNGIPSNVLEVVYSADFVYVGCTGIPGYSIGPWSNNPNDAGDQDWEFKITLDPVQNTGAPVNTPLGHIGVWTNGVTIFNPRDAMSYLMQNIWHQNAFYFEGAGFDACLGHPNQQMEYHTHINPTCLYDDADSSQHSPIIGFAFDGFPVYGAYGYANTDGTGGIVRMRSSYQERAITDRTTLPDGTVLNANQYGPAIGGQYPMGAYVEDHEFIQGSGDLDEHNGRFCVTPEYPNGIYAYFVTIDADLQPVYPYVLGPAYYGTVLPGNTGPGSGHNSIDEAVTVYDPFTGVEEAGTSLDLRAYPNPTSEHLVIDGLEGRSAQLTMTDARGAVVMNERVPEGMEQWTIYLQRLSRGNYLVMLTGDGIQWSRSIVLR
ncbi:MAG: YHYH protein [Flavobacteriales bacterium]|nr:YHYH protein [Flavobacteriales bacterium]